jgi:hypothetical protein
VQVHQNRLRGDLARQPAALVMRHDGNAELLTGIEGVSSRPVRRVVLVG